MALDHLQKLTDIGQINLILKSLALRSFERNKVAGLHGERWIEFLLSKLKNHTFSSKELTETTAKIWDTRAITSEELNQFKMFSYFWIKHYYGWNSISVGVLVGPGTIIGVLAAAAVEVKAICSDFSKYSYSIYPVWNILEKKCLGIEKEFVAVDMSLVGLGLYIVCTLLPAISRSAWDEGEDS